MDFESSLIFNATAHFQAIPHVFRFTSSIHDPIAALRRTPNLAVARQAWK
jgi:hypothetical protein